MATNLNKDYQQTGLDTAINGVPVSFRPISTVMPMPTAPVLTTTVPAPQPPTPTPTNTSGTGGIPKALLNCTATQTAYPQQTYTDSIVTISFTRDTTDPNFDHVNIWFVGYHGNINPQLMASGNSSPLSFAVDSTKETVSVYVQTVSATGASAQIQFAAHTTVTLSGVVSNPPFPTVTQTLVTTPVGYQFQFAYLGSLIGDTISGYNIYRNTTNTSSGATKIKFVAQPASRAGNYTYQESVVNGQNYYYFVSAVNTTGLESSIVSCQSGLVTNVSLLNSSGQLITTQTYPLTGVPNSSTWYKMGTWVFPAAAAGYSLGIEYQSGSGASSGGAQQSVTDITIRSGGNSAAPNLSGITWQGNGGTQAVLAVKAAATGGSTSSSNTSWDIYVELAAESDGTLILSLPATSTWTQIGASSSDPGAASTTVVVGTGNQLTNASSQIINADLIAADGSVNILGHQYASSTITVANGNFEASTTLPPPGWGANGGIDGVAAYETGSPQSGNQSLKLSNSAASELNSNQLYGCVPGDQFLIGGYVKSDGTATPYIGVNFYDKTGSFLGNGLAGNGTNTSWTYVTQVGTAPANTVSMQVICYSSTSGTGYYDGIVCWKLGQLGVQTVDGPSNFSATASTLTYRPTSNPLSASDAGSNATISIGSFAVQTSNKGSISYNSGSVTALSYSTLYYVYLDDATLGGGTVTFHATTTKVTAITGVGRIFIGSIVTPAATAMNTVGNNDGGVGAQNGQTDVFLGGSNTIAVATNVGVTGTPSNFYDGSFTTFYAQKNGGSSGAVSGQLKYQGMSPSSAPWSSLTLNVLTAVPSNAANCAAELEYSLDGGNSYTVIYNLTATTRALTNDQITLPNNQNLALVVIRATITRSSGTNAVEQDLYEFWVTGLQ